MNENFIKFAAAVAKLWPSIQAKQVDWEAALEVNAYGSLTILDLKRGKNPVIGESQSDQEAHRNATLQILEVYTQATGHSVPIGATIGRNGEVIKLILPILIKYLLPLIIAQAPKMVEIAVMHKIEQII